MLHLVEMEEEQCLHECESYIQSHNIQILLKDCIVQLCVNKPENPITYLRQHFQKLERVRTLINYLFHVVGRYLANNYYFVKIILIMEDLS